MRPALFLLFALALPGAGASHGSPVDVMHVRELADARWIGAEGQENRGVLGEGEAFFTVEDPSTLAHDDLAACYGQGFTQMTPLPPIEGPTPGNSPLAGHGTWTTGVVCASGAASSGHHRGLAPAAKVLFVAGLLGDPHERGALQQGLFDAHQPFVATVSNINDPRDQIAPLAAGADVLVAWAAGNEGGDGRVALAKDPGAHAKGEDARILVVAAATWDGTAVADYSSRGARSDPATWPDLSAVGCHTVPVPRTQPGSINPYNVAGFPSACWAPTQAEHAGLAMDSYVLTTGTSFAAPSVAAVLLLMHQVHPGLATADARTLLLGTTDVFLPTSDQDGDGNVTRQDFWLQHGFAAGHGLVNASAAVAAAHYLGLHAGSNASEALACARAEREGGLLTLNPDPRCAPAPPPVVAVEPDPVAANGTPSSSDGPAPSGNGQAKRSPAPWPALALLAVTLLARRQRPS